MSQVLIQRHGAVQMALRLPATTSYVLLRYLLVPPLYLPYKLGVSTSWACKIDSGVKRAVFPLSERPDDQPSQHVSPALQIGAPLPEVTLRQGGEQVQLSALARGRPLLLVLFRGSWCPYSRMHLSDLAQHHQQFTERGIDILAVSSQQDEQWWRSKGVNLPMAVDEEGTLFKEMGVAIDMPLHHRVWGARFPHESVFLFDRNSKLVAYDTRKVSNTKLRQTFLSAEKWLEVCQDRRVSA